MRSKILFVVGLLVLAFVAGYVLSQASDSNKEQSTTTTNNQPATPTENQTNGSLKSLASYTLPDGWIENTCEASSAVFVIPNGSTANCDNNPVAPVKLSVDSGNTTDCNQLQNQSQVKKHTCISEFINGRKTLKASTEFLASSSFTREMVVNAYYFDSGSGVVLAEYMHAPDDNNYQADFERLAKSLRTQQ